METNNTRWAVIKCTPTRSVVGVFNAASKNEALALCAVAADRDRAPASWDAWPVSDLPADLRTMAEAVAIGEVES